MSDIREGDMIPEGAIRAAELATAEMRRALNFGAFLDDISRPTRTIAVIEGFAERHPPKLTKKDKMRQAIARRDSDDCWLCGKPLGDDATIEHHVPRSAGGSGDIANLRLCHELCNRALAHRTPEEKVALRQATLAAGIGKPGAAR